MCCICVSCIYRMLTHICMTMDGATKMLVCNLNKDHYNISLSLSSMIVAELLQTRKHITWMSVLYNVILPGQGPHKTHCGRENMASIFADDMFVCIFVNRNFRISNKISLKYVPYGPIDNESLSEKDDIVYWRIYSTLGLNELICFSFDSNKAFHWRDNIAMS